MDDASPGRLRIAANTVRINYLPPVRARRHRHRGQSRQDRGAIPERARPDAPTAEEISLLASVDVRIVEEAGIVDGERPDRHRGVRR